MLGLGREKTLRGGLDEFRSAGRRGFRWLAALLLLIALGGAVQAQDAATQASPQTQALQQGAAGEADENSSRELEREVRSRIPDLQRLFRDYPIAPPDTSSPRATLESFLLLMHEADPAKGGLKLAESMDECPEECRARVFYQPPKRQRAGKKEERASTLRGEPSIDERDVPEAAEPVDLEAAGRWTTAMDLAAEAEALGMAGVAAAARAIALTPVREEHGNGPAAPP